MHRAGTITIGLAFYGAGNAIREVVPEVARIVGFLGLGIMIVVAGSIAAGLWRQNRA